MQERQRGVGLRRIPTHISATVRRAARNRRQNRWRRNAAASVQVCPVKVSRVVLDWLVEELRWVDPGKSGDRCEIGQAISEGLEEAARHRRKNL
jgi:hypothetical protein